MANTLITCDTCPAMVLDSVIKTVQTSKGPMKVCKKCYAEHVQLTTTQHNTTNQEPVRVEAPETTSYLQSISHVSNPESVPHPENPKKKFTQSQLFAEYLTNAQVKISDIFNEARPGYELGKAYAELEERIELMESIVFQAKTEASEYHKKKRELDALSGKNRWDRERRGENKSNLVDPRDSQFHKRKADKRSVLTKIEGLVKNMMDMGDTDDEIITMMTSTGKFKGIEIREAIQKFRS